MTGPERHPSLHDSFPWHCRASRTSLVHKRTDGYLKKGPYVVLMILRESAIRRVHRSFRVPIRQFLSVFALSVILFCFVCCSVSVGYLSTNQRLIHDSSQDIRRSLVARPVRSRFPKSTLCRNFIRCLAPECLPNRAKAFLLNPIFRGRVLYSFALAPQMCDTDVRSGCYADPLTLLKNCDATALGKICEAVSGMAEDSTAYANFPKRSLVIPSSIHVDARGHRASCL